MLSHIVFPHIIYRQFDTPRTSHVRVCVIHCAMQFFIDPVSSVSNQWYCIGLSLRESPLAYSHKASMDIWVRWTWWLFWFFFSKADWADTNILGVEEFKKTVCNKTFWHALVLLSYTNSLPARKRNFRKIHVHWSVIVNCNICKWISQLCDLLVYWVSTLE